MVISRKPLAVVAVTGLLASLAACGGGSTSDNNNAGKKGVKGGTLYYLTNRPTEHLDPQRVYIGRDIADLNRLVYRQLVTYPIGREGKEALTPVPDLATDTGQSTNDAKTWSFTLKDGVKWQDGKDITCEDLKYGMSRSFATDVIIGGPTYILSFLDVPKDKDGLPLYNGPYKNKHKADFDKAVTCKDKTITYKFSKPFPDFPLAIASLASFAPFRKDQDQGDKSNYAIFASGPYKLDGKWNTTKGGTFVRNSKWDQGTDDVRKPLPDKYVFTQGIKPEVITDRFISDSGNDAASVTDQEIPPSAYSRITGPVQERSTNTNSPFVNYLVPNFNQMTNPKVRQALLMSTNTAAYSETQGGSKASGPADSLVNPDVIGYAKNPAYDAPRSGDPAGAKTLLQQSGEQLPYPIKYTYQGGTPTTDKGAAALKATWEKAGFKVTLDPLAETYYDIIQKPTNDSDVMIGGWGADWPSVSTVIPPLFDSRVNLTSASNANDYGAYRSDTVNKLIDKAASLPDVNEQAKVYAQADEEMGKDVAYIPLDISRFYRLHGSKVTGYSETAPSNGYPELGTIGVQQ